MKAKVLKNEAEYEEALEYISELMDAAPGSPEETELELFSLLVEVYEKDHYPIDLPDPVEAIKFRMEQEGLTRKDLALYMGSLSRVSDVFNRKRPLSLTMIRSLHSGLGIPYDVLLQEQGKSLKPKRFLFSDFPFNEMVKRGYFETFTGTLATAKEFSEELLESFFSVFGDTEPEYIYCRKNKEIVDYLALKSWRARVIHLADKKKISGYHKDKLDRSFLKEIVSLSKFSEGPRLVGELLNKKGVHFIILPHLDKTYLDGACFAMPDGQPVIALTLRHDRLDNFWFTLLHELAHMMHHLDKKSVAFFDDTDRGHTDKANIYEKEADTCAREMLISGKEWKPLKKKLEKNLTESTLNSIANDLGISPAIVAGRLRWENNDYSIFSKLIGNKMVRKLFAA